jgi:hypothetical protein
MPEQPITSEYANLSDDEDFTTESATEEVVESAEEA